MLGGKILLRRKGSYSATHCPISGACIRLLQNTDVLDATIGLSMLARTVARALSRFGLDQRGIDPHPRRPIPMLLQRADAMFSAPDWTYEPKWDGFRVLATVRNGYVRLVS